MTAVCIGDAGDDAILDPECEVLSKIAIVKPRGCETGLSSSDRIASSLRDSAKALARPLSVQIAHEFVLDTVNEIDSRPLAELAMIESRELRDMTASDGNGVASFADVQVKHEKRGLESTEIATRLLGANHAVPSSGGWVPYIIVTPVRPDWFQTVVRTIQPKLTLLCSGTGNLW